MYDIVIIGAGPGGYHAAIRAAQYDAKAVSYTHLTLPTSDLV